MAVGLFVYGTLAPGQPNEHILAGLAGEWQPGIVRGRLLPNGWGAALGFPAIILDDTAPEVAGLLFSSAELDEHWERLDEFEGEGYQRELTVVRLEDGTRSEAFIYTLAESLDDV